MEYVEFKEKFEKKLTENGLSKLSEEKIELFYRHFERLMEVNQITNLTAIRDVDGVISKHYVDSLLISKWIKEGARVLDLGCGPGFPSLPLAIARPDLSIVGLDSTAKKIAFVNESSSLLCLSNLHAVSGRAEDAKMIRDLGAFDVVVSRAVANPIVLCELSLSYLKIGGRMLAMKGARIDEEAAELNQSRILGIMGAKQAISHAWNLITDEGIESRGVIEVVKEKNGDPKYPRSYSMIVKKPL